jgi:hypothetical protein
MLPYLIGCKNCFCLPAFFAMFGLGHQGRKVWVYGILYLYLLISWGGEGVSKVSFAGVRGLFDQSIPMILFDR